MFFRFYRELIGTSGEVKFLIGSQFQEEGGQFQEEGNFSCIFHCLSFYVESPTISYLSYLLIHL